jgi:esterase/lipase
METRDINTVEEATLWLKENGYNYIYPQWEGHGHIRYMYASMKCPIYDCAPDFYKADSENRIYGFYLSRASILTYVNNIISIK